MYELLRAGRPQVEHVNLACGGETAGGMIRGGACNPQVDGHARYARRTQLAEAVAFLRAHRQHIAFITIDIGGNDANLCIERARGAGCVARVLENVGRIAAELRAAAGPATPIVDMSYYSPYLASWLKGEEGRRTAARLGELPRNLQHICQWTSMCTAGDLHPNAEGYGVIAKAFAAALK